MFTGLVQAVGEVVSMGSETPGGVARLVISPGGWSHRPGVGDSICVSGCCLTVAGLDDDRGAWLFDAVPETLARTKLGGLKPGDRVNLEHSLLPTTLMGGHLVQGHVDGVGEVVKVQRGDDWRIRIRPADRELLRYMAPKGGVAIDGVSLTIASVGAIARAARTTERAAKAANDPGFEIVLIPTTLAKTTLGELMPGAMVNIEADITAKTIVHYIENYGMPRVLAPKRIAAEEDRGGGESRMGRRAGPGAGPSRGPGGTGTGGRSAGPRGMGPSGMRPMMGRGPGRDLVEVRGRGAGPGCRGPGGGGGGRRGDGIWTEEAGTERAARAEVTETAGASASAEGRPETG
ncbi:MAG: riboflavin synthase [Phycisphaeraceae bacterium]|nr:riboflavin synthase [Phycisphaeraceae bacterium]